MTGLDVRDFELLCSLGVFNSSLMTDAIFKFRRYEDASLTYTGIDRHEEEDVGGWDTVVKREEYRKLFYNQQATMEPSKRREHSEFFVPAEDAVSKPVTKAVQKPNEREPETVPAMAQIPLSARPQAGQNTVSVQKPEAQKPQIDLSGIVPGTTVHHRKFGTGQVVRLDQKQRFIHVAFQAGEKKFLFPDVFETGFLTM